MSWELGEAYAVVPPAQGQKKKALTTARYRGHCMDPGADHGP